MSNGSDTAAELLNGFILGGEAAFKRFYRLSGGYWLDHAPEYFLTSHAAAAISNSSNTTAWMEASVEETRTLAAAVGRGRPHGQDRPNGRYDIVLYWENGSPRAVVEVKSPIWFPDTTKLSPDFLLLSKTMAANRECPLEFCALLYYASVDDPKRTFDNASQRLRKLVLDVHEQAKNMAIKYKLSAVSRGGRIHRSSQDPGAWTISASIFVRPGSEQFFE